MFLEDSDGRPLAGGSGAVRWCVRPSAWRPPSRAWTAARVELRLLWGLSASTEGGEARCDADPAHRGLHSVVMHRQPRSCEGTWM